MITSIYAIAERRKGVGEKRYGIPWPPAIDGREATLEALQEIVDAFNYTELLLHIRPSFDLEYIEKIRAELRSMYENLRVSYLKITDDEIVNHKRKGK